MKLYSLKYLSALYHISGFVVLSPDKKATARPDKAKSDKNFLLLL